MVTAYDYPSAKHVDRAGIDIVLVGDSCAMVELGYENTLCITLDEMIYHCKAVKRGAPHRPLLVGDMPFGSYEYEDVDIALRNAYKMVKEGGMDAVKVEGGTEKRCTIVRHLVQGGSKYIYIYIYILYYISCIQLYMKQTHDTHNSLFLLIIYIYIYIIRARTRTHTHAYFGIS